MSIKSMPGWKWALLLLASFIIAVLLYGLSDEAVRLVPIGWIRWIGCVAAAAWIPALYSVLVKWIEKSPAKDVPKRILNIGTDRSFLIVDSFFLFLIVAIGEELMFRGVIFRWIDEKWGFTAALGGVDASLIHAKTDGPDILTGGSFGAEVSIIAVIIGAAISAYFIIKSVRASRTAGR